MSPELRALTALRAPPAEATPGEMWLCRQLGIVLVYTRHKRGQARRTRLTSFHLYHFGERAMFGRPCDWRDGDPNSSSLDPRTSSTHQKWEYVGNIFEMLPYRLLAAEYEVSP